MKSSIERIFREGKHTRLNGASDVEGGFNCMGVVAVLGTDPSDGLRHDGMCMPPRFFMCPAP
jgi:hypothetical protein